MLQNSTLQKSTLQKSRLFTLLILALASCAMLLPAHASASVSVPITGTYTDSNGGVGQFVGTFSPQTFGVQSGKLVAIGTLTGNMTNADGTSLGTVSNANTAFPVASSLASCTILTLNLGPLHLNLLGLVVNLNQVVLNITAVPGPGNLLGNLLCAIANLLNGGNLDLGAIATLLNRILMAL